MRLPRDATTALDQAAPDHVVDLERLPALLDSLVHQPAGEPGETPPSLAFEVRLRRALASAQRALEERVALAGKLRGQAQRSGHRHMAENWSARAQEYEHEMNVIRDAIRRMDDLVARSLYK